LLLRASVSAMLLHIDVLTMFCSGPTREEIRLSEAQSYANIVQANDYFGHSDIMPSTPSFLIEDRALDSYHNVLFSLTLFYSHYKAWPSHLTIVSHAFKKPRLVDHHCTAIGFSLDEVSFIGIDPPGLDTADVGIGKALKEWKEDPHGRGDSLRGKRQRRNPWNRRQSIFDEENEHSDRGGLVTMGHSDEETLVDDAPRPW